MRGQTAMLVQQVQGLTQIANTREVPDEELVRRYVEESDPDAFEVLLGRLGPMVLRLCRRVLHDAHEAEDAFQAAFLVLARKAGQIRRRAAVAGWLHGIAYRIALKMRTRTDRRVRRHQEIPERTPAPDLLAEISVREAQAIVDQELAGLPERQRLPLVLCYLEGATQDEAARRLGLPPGTLRSRLERGRQRLRTRLARRGLTLSAALLALRLGEGAACAVLPTSLLRSTAAICKPSVAGGAVPAVPPRVESLTRGVLRTSLQRPLTRVLAPVMVLGLIGVGLCFAPDQKQPPTREGVADRPVVAERPARPADTDQQGDPLPPGALLRLGTLRFRHDNWVMSAAVSPDGKVIAASGGSHVQLWAASDGKEIRRFDLPQVGWNTPVAFSPDSKILAIGSDDCLIRLWDIGSGRLLRQCAGHEKPKRDPRKAIEIPSGIYRITFSPEGKTLASYAGDKTVRLWEVATGREVRQFREESDAGLIFSPDGKTLIAGARTKDNAGLIILWDVATGKERKRWQIPTTVSSLALTPDGKILATGTSNEKKGADIILWDMETGKQTRCLEGHRRMVVSLAFSPEGKTLASAAPFPEFTVRLWDVASGKEVHRISAPASSFGVAYIEGGTLISWGAANTVHFWDPKTGKQMRRFEGHEASVYDLAFSPDGKWLATSVGSESLVGIWDTASGKEVARLREQGEERPNVTAVAFSPDGKLLAAGSADGSVRLWQPDTRKLVRRLEVCRGWVKTVVFSPDGKRLASAGEDKVIHLWDVTSGREVRQWAANPAIYRLAFSPDGTRLAMGAGAGTPTIRVWDVATGDEVPLIRQDDRSGVTSLEFSLDGRMLAASNLADTIRLWELATGQERLLIKHPGHVTSIAFSPDSRLLASANNGQTSSHGEGDTSNKGRAIVRLWDTLTGKEIRGFEGHRGGVMSLDFAPDGKRLASGSHDTTVLIWDVQAVRKAMPTGTVTLSPKELQAAWADLSSASSATAYRALARLARAPAQSVPFFRKHVRPVPPPPDPTRLARLLVELDSPVFATREKATRELGEMGEAAEGPLRRALKNRPSLEVRKRIEELLGRLSSEGKHLRVLRALEALERAGTPELLELLRELGRGQPGAWLTREATTVLSRSTDREEHRP
jgi:RNA polymerase sigma factor (sigma-70 family)